MYVVVMVVGNDFVSFRCVVFVWVDSLYMVDVVGFYDEVVLW